MINVIIPTASALTRFKMEYWITILSGTVLQRVPLVLTAIKVHKPSLNPVAAKSSCHSVETGDSSNSEISAWGAIGALWYFAGRRDIVSSCPVMSGTATRW